LYALDVIQFQAGVGKISHYEYLKVHAELMDREAWIIDGFGCAASSWERFSVADTLIYVDLPLSTHYLWVTKRLFKGFLRNPEGWPENSPIWSSTLEGYRVIPLCDRQLTPRYRQLVAEASGQRVHHLKSRRQIREFLRAVEQECGPLNNRL